MAIKDKFGIEVHVNDIVRFTDHASGRPRERYALVTQVGRKYLTVETSAHTHEGVVVTGLDVTHSGSVETWSSAIRQARRDAVDAYAAYLALQCPATEDAFNHAQASLKQLEDMFRRMTGKEVNGIL